MTPALGSRFGERELVAVDGAKWLMRCACGAERWCRRCDVIAGRSRRCLSCAMTRHGFARRGQVSRLFKIWRGVKHRCFNPKSNRWEHYGGRGITMAPEWAANFEAFARDVGEPPPGRTLDRIDVDGPYAPGNVRWATAAEQNANRRARGTDPTDDDFADGYLEP